jgi:replicative DNA helicase
MDAFDQVPSGLVPPQNLQAEESVIGGCLIDPHGYSKVSHMLQVDDFYDHRNKIIFNAIGALVADGSAVDILLVDEYLRSKGLSEKVGGLAHLGGISRDTPSAANIAHYAAIIREKSMLRAVLKTANEMTAAAMDANGAGAKAIIELAENQIFALGQMGLRGKQGFSRMREILGAVVDEMESNLDNPPKDGVRGLSTGFDDLDQLTGGMSPGDLVLIAARPSMGKTSLAMNMAEHVALVKQKPVAIFSMEMQKAAIAQRCLSSISGAGLRKIRDSWTIQDNDWTLLSAGIARLNQSPLFIDDTPALTISSIRSRALRLVSELSDEFPGGLGAIVVDYIQLMGVDGRSDDNRNGQIEVISRGLKQLAKELGIPVFALSQLNRNCDSRPNKRPVMSDLRDSGSLEQDADLILFLYRDEVYNKESVDKGVAELIIGKQRNGALGVVRLMFDGACTRFRNAARGGYVGEYDE